MLRRGERGMDRIEVELKQERLRFTLPATKKRNGFFGETIGEELAVLAGGERCDLVVRVEVVAVGNVFRFGADHLVKPVRERPAAVVLEIRVEVPLADLGGVVTAGGEHLVERDPP